jgi:hypothetical protein
LRRLRWLLAPERLEQLVAWDDVVCVQEEDSEERTLFRRSDVERAAVVEHFERAENPEVHVSVADANTHPA